MQGKVAIVTGASSGIGRATAALFAENGASVVAVGRNEKELAALSKSVDKNKGAIKMHLGDVLEMTQIDRIVGDTMLFACLNRNSRMR